MEDDLPAAATGAGPIRPAAAARPIESGISALVAATARRAAAPSPAGGLA